ncbi:MAG: hypothetical protein ACR2F6_09435 [Mycobacteriales bacterium]
MTPRVPSTVTAAGPKILAVAGRVADRISLAIAPTATASVLTETGAGAILPADPDAALDALRTLYAARGPDPHRASRRGPFD